MRHSLARSIASWLIHPMGSFIHSVTSPTVRAVPLVMLLMVATPATITTPVVSGTVVAHKHFAGGVVGKYRRQETHRQRMLRRPAQEKSQSGVRRKGVYGENHKRARRRHTHTHKMMLLGHDNQRSRYYTASHTYASELMWR